ncbi:MAG: fused MFS/spermidine synthase [Sandaracinaceae bacterium]|nr:fused MFS/spermidine synthase [Sandaracinaceae bacterium]MBK7156198.1 fused MFS/spermidine synthase [Sandaracinaceae bacterium]MBK8406629.1 fused MFS/spermidine synthase [Sandaracinaceae bacterium]
MSVRLALYPALFCSGAAALVYESVWARMLHRVFGVGDLAIATVLACFFLGLGIGSALGGRLALRVRSPARTYALLEVGVAVWAFGSLWALPELHRVYALVGAGQSFGLLTLIRFLLCLPVLLPPTIAMGATLPILVRATSEWGTERATANASAKLGWGSEATWLYATNTLGAVFGAGASGFYLLPELGARLSLVAAALASLVAAAIVMIARRAHARWTPGHVNLDPFALEHATSELAPDDGSLAFSLPTRAFVAATLAGGAGLASLASEVLWTRVLRTIVQGTTQAFAAMLVNYLLGIGVGALLADRLVRGGRSPLRVFGLCQLALALLTGFAIAAVPQLPRLIVMLHGAPVTIPHEVSVLMIVSSLLLLPLALVLGTSIPLAWQMVRDDSAHAAGHAGRVLAFNTLGGLLGSLLAGFVLVPAIGVERALYLVIGLHALLASLALALSGTRLPRRVFGALVPVLAVLCIVALRPSLQLAWLLDAWHDGNATAVSGPERGEPCQNGTCDGEAVCIEGHCNDTVRFMREGRNTTVTLLTRDGSSYRLFNDGRPESGFSPGNPGFGSELALLGALPSLLAATPERAMAIGFGGGHTTTMLLAGPFQRVDVVELEEAVIDAARIMHANFDKPFPLDDERVHPTFDDARAQLLLAPAGTYDAVVSQPSHPWLAGSSALYTEEFFREVQHSLRPGGVLVQWVNLFRMDIPSLRSVVATLLAVFDHVHCYVAEDSSFIMVAGDAPLAFGQTTIDRLDANRPLQDTLSAVELGTLVELVSVVELDTAGSRRFADGAPVIHDDRPTLEFALARLEFYSELDELALDQALVGIPWLSRSSIDALPRTLLPDAFLFRAEHVRNRRRSLTRAEQSLADATLHASDQLMVQGTLAELRGDLRSALRGYAASQNRDAVDRLDYLRHVEGMDRDLLRHAQRRQVAPYNASHALAACLGVGEPALCDGALRAAQLLRSTDDDALESAARAFTEGGCPALLLAVGADEEALEEPDAAFRALECAVTQGAPAQRVSELAEAWTAGRIRVAAYERKLAEEANEGLNLGLAMRHYVHTLRYDPRDGEAAAALARLLVQAGDTDRARGFLQRTFDATRSLSEPHTAVERAARDLGITLR